MMVSLVLNNKWQKSIFPAITEKIRRSAKKHSIALNVAGRSLVMHRNFRIAICANSAMIDHPVMGAYSFHELLEIISEELSRLSYSIDIFRLDKYKSNIEDFDHRFKEELLVH